MILLIFPFFHYSAARGIQECHYCKELTATISCSTCATDVFRTEGPYVFFCSRCFELIHRSRKGHKVEEIEVKEVMGDISKFSKMQLLSVICIETSHYVCYTRTNNRWLFHDSMANRICKDTLFILLHIFIHICIFIDILLGCT